VTIRCPHPFTMRKYRFGDANSAAGFLKRTNIIYIFLAWNVVGFCTYQWYKSRKSKDSAWTNMSSAQRYLSMMTHEEDKVAVVSVTGLKVDSKKVTDVRDYLIPKKPTPQQSKADEL